MLLDIINLRERTKSKRQKNSRAAFSTIETDASVKNDYYEIMNCIEWKLKII